MIDILGSAQKIASNIGSDFGTIGANFPGHITHRLLGSAWNIASSAGSLFRTLSVNFPGDIQGWGSQPPE